MGDRAPRIAIVGMAGRFPGARSLDGFWENLKAGKDCITQLTPEQIAPNEPELEALLDKPNFRTARGMLDDVDQFDAPFFGFSPREASVLDPQQRLWFEACWAALEQAGVDPARYAGPIGVYGGAGYMEQYLLYNLLKDRRYIEDLVKLRATDSYQVLLANDKDYLPTRTAYKFNLRGPAINVQTACSTSLVALHMAAQSLLAFESDLALAGAVSIGLPQARGYLTQEGGMTSLDGLCRPFDAQASGTVFSSGLGVFLLKRFDEAVDDGDDILAVLRGSALNNDGAGKVSFLAPSPDGQAEVIAMAQAVADVHPDEISYVEAHGTATPLGDPIEIDGLTRAWRRKSEAKGQVMIGSVKSNIGHVDSAAGAASLIKTIYALRNQELPATVHFEAPNPRIDFAATPFRVVSQLTPWPRGDKPRLAGISSFGVGGTNAHVVIEEAPTRAAASPPPRPQQLLVLSAKTPTALVQRCEDLADWLDANGSEDLADVAWTLATGRSEMAFRCHVVAADNATAATQLRAAARAAAKRPPTEAIQPPVAMLFPGQGAQHPGMCKGLYDTEPGFRQTIDQLAKTLEPLLQVDVRTLIFAADDAPEAASRLRDTGIAQPALFVVQLAMARLWAHWGVQPESMLGHSVGEYVAACLAGVWSEAEACKVLANRASLMADLPGGSMLAVRRSEDQVAGLLSDDVALAAINGPALCILSGSDAAIDAIAGELDEAGEETIRLHTSHAFHSPMMQPALAPFEAIVANAELKPPEQPFVSCLTGQIITAEQACDPAYWSAQLGQTVRFSPALTTLLDNPTRIFLECGPSQNLTAAVRQHKRDGAAVACVPSQAHASAEADATTAMLDALGKLWQAGVTPDWSGVFEHATAPRRLVHLPTYPFERKRYWVDPPQRGPSDNAVPSAAPVTMPAAAPTPQPQETPMPAIERKAHLADQLRDIILNLSGTEIAPEDDGVSFPEMGMDSLFLTQAAAELSETFGVQLRFRQLLEDINTLELLAEYLDAELPDDAFQPAAIQQPNQAAGLAVVQPGNPALPAAAGLALASNDPVQSLIQQQLDIMRQQLAVFGASGQPSAAQHSAAGVAQPATTTASAGPAVQASLRDGQQGNNLAAVGAGRFGPYKAIARDKDAGLSEAQQQWLDGLIETLTGKTAGSKQLAADKRQYLADPRAVANFRLAWKELVYQIAAEQTEGSRMVDIDGNTYVDITMGFGVGFMGHRHPVVVDAVKRQLDKGFEVGPQTPLAPIVAEKFCRIVGHDRVSFCNTGSEGIMAALRCARTVTNRSKVVYFTGDYHGTFDEVLARANIVKGQLTTRPAAPGIAQDAVDNVMILDYGTQESLDIIREQAGQIAAVLVEPVQSRYPELQPSDFVREVRRITADAGCALIMDEVITGFRTALGGLKELWDIDPDMCCYGKVLGGGLPIGAVAGKAKWLDTIDGGPWQYGDDSLPEAPVTFFAGTFVRHPLVMAAANAVLDFLGADDGELQRDLNARTKSFAADMNAFFESAGAPIRIRQCSSWFRFDFPQDQPFVNLLFYYMVANGVYIREAAQNCFFSIAHTDDDIDRVKQVIREGTAALQAAGFIATGANKPTEPATTETVAASGEPAAKPTPDSGAGLAVGETMPLTEAQREIWLSQMVQPDSAAANNEPFYADMEGQLDVDALRAACQGVYERHEALHLRVAEDGEHQTRIEPETLDIPLIDCSGEPDPLGAALEKVGLMSSLEFDLSTGPLLEMAVFRVAERRHLLGMVVHHIVCDGWSSVVLLEEMGALYSARARGQTIQLPPPVSFSGYAKRQVAADANNAQQRDFWVQRLADPPAALTLPTDHERPAEKTFNGATFHHDFQLDTLRGVRRLAADLKVTPYAVLLAAFQALLGRLANQDDIVIGIPVAGQALEGQNELFGHCTQTLPVRARFSGQTSFADLVAAARDGIRDAYNNANVRFGAILQQLKLPRDASRLPLLEVSFNVDPAGEGVAFHGLEVTLHETPKTHVNFDLFFNLTLGKQLLKLDCDYNTDLFTRDTLRSWALAFEAILEQVAGDTNRPISDLKLGSGQSLTHMIEGFNPPPLDYDTKTDVGTVFRQTAQQHAKAVAVYHDTGNLTYAQLDGQSDAVAAALAGAGVAPGDRVGISLPRTPKLLAAMIAVFKAGASCVTLDPAYPAERLAFIRDDAGIKLSLIDGETTIVGEVMQIDGALASTEPPPRLPPDGEREAYLLYTSGSTGTPKGVQTLQRNLLALVAWAHASFEPADFKGLLGATSVGFDISMFELFAPLTCGGAIVLVENVVALAQPETLPGAVTWVNTVPTPLAEVLRVGDLPDSVRVVTCGGEPFTRGLVDRVYSQSNVSRVFDCYGPTEATVYSTSALRLRGGDETIGKPIPGWRCYVLGEDGQPVPENTVGELCIGGAGVTAGYWNRADLTDKSFVPDPFVGGQARMYRTGDLARWRPDGQLVFLGRADTQVKVRGFRIELGEIESVLRAHEAVSEAVVRVIDKADGDAQLVAYWQPAPGVDTAPTAAELRRYCHSKVPLHMVPQQLLRVDAWPKTPSGKLDRKALPNPFEKSQGDGQSTAADQDHADALLAVWSELLGAPVDAQPQDSFLDLGGHSFLAVRAVQTVRKQHGIDIPVRAMMLETVAQLAVRMSEAPAETAVADADGDAVGKKGGRLAALFGLKRSN